MEDIDNKEFAKDEKNSVKKEENIFNNDNKTHTKIKKKKKIKKTSESSASVTSIKSNEEEIKNNTEIHKIRKKKKNKTVSEFNINIGDKTELEKNKNILDAIKSLDDPENKESKNDENNDGA